MKIKAKDSKLLNKCIYGILKPTYFNEIPLQQLFAQVKDCGYTVVQEDNTPWTGMLVGINGEAIFRYKHTKTDELVENSMLVLTWHRMQSGKTEVCGYIS